MKSIPLDILADAARWLPVASGEALLRLASKDQALQLDFNFNGGGGFVVARREVEVPMPETFSVRLRLSGEAPANHFEVKLVDATGQNVWRWTLREFTPNAAGTNLHIESHEFEFAWGPAGGGSISYLGAIEFAVVAKDGGTGLIAISDLSLGDHDLHEPPLLAVSSSAKAPAVSLHGVGQWLPKADDSRPWLTLDFAEIRLFGGMIITWASADRRAEFAILGSDDGVIWETLKTVPQSRGARSYIYLPCTRCRHLKLELASPVGVTELQWQGFEFSRSIEDFWHSIASIERRGAFPRWLSREQSLWTVIGATRGNVCALMNEEGMIELNEGSFSIEPMISVNGQVFTWADAKPQQSLREDWMPIPSVCWNVQHCTFQIEAIASDDGAIHVSYQATNNSAQIQTIRVFAAVRPFQVSPPWQRFRDVGGVSRIHQVDWRDGVLSINQQAHLYTTDATKFVGLGLDDGLLVDALAAESLTNSAQVSDSFGFANGALVFEFKLAPSETRRVGWSTSPTGNSINPWSSKLPTTCITASSWAREVLQTQLTATAHVLITRSGAPLQPGPRRYTRSWIRDGTVMAAALLRMGCTAEVRDFIEWYAPYLRADGFVPCCVDREGPDSLVEHDSHGQWIALIADYYRFSHDRAFVSELWPSIVRVVGYIESIMEADGLLPISVSHEGYLSQPVHSYWDDFWALHGLREAVSLGQVFGHEVGPWQTIADRLSAGLFASIEATRAEKQLDYIPGSHEWADFDPTATANALWLFNLPPLLNREAVERTFDKYLYDWRRKRTGELDWKNYTAYEIRIIGAFVRLGKREEALELLRFFLSDRRPLSWNQWPEISWRNPSAPGHIGDVPHTWISAEYVLAVRSLFAYETPDELVLAAGIANEWIDGDGVRVQAMPTIFGSLNYTLRRESEESLWFEISGDLTLPKNGIRVCAPGTHIQEVLVTAVPAHFQIGNPPLS